MYVALQMMIEERVKFYHWSQTGKITIFYKAVARDMSPYP